MFGAENIKFHRSTDEIKQCRSRVDATEIPLFMVESEK